MRFKFTIFSVLSVAAALLSAVSCSHGPSAGQVVRVHPLYRSVADFTALDAAARQQVMHADSAALWAYAAFMGADTLDASTIEALAATPAVRVFTPAVDSVYPRLDQVNHELSHLWAALKDQGISPLPAQCAAVVWGSAKSVVIAGDCLLLALNHFLGEKHPAYASWPAYMREGKSPESIPYAVAEALLATRCAYEAKDGAPSEAVARMLYAGALVHGVMATVDGASLAVALGYTPGQLSWLEDNERNIWAAMVARDMVYTADAAVVDRLLSPAPATPLFGPQCPGRVGRYIGYRLVQQYLKKHPGTDVKTLLSPGFYNNSTVCQGLSL